jgi:hypothetical protein
MNTDFPELEVYQCLNKSDSLKNMYIGLLQSKLSGIMTASDMGEMKQALKYM